MHFKPLKIFQLPNSIYIHIRRWLQQKLDLVYVIKKKQAKKSIFAPKIAPRVERSDPARNSYFPADFLSAR